MARVDGGEAFGETAPGRGPRSVAGELVHGAGRSAVEALCLRADKLAEPDVAEIHQLAVLDVAEVGRVGENGVEACGGSSTAVELVQRIETLRVPVLRCNRLADPLARDRHDDLAARLVPHLERRVAVALRLGVFLDDVGPAAGADIGAVAVDDAEQVGFALHQADGEAMNREDVQRFQRHGVVAAQHVLIAQQVGKVRRERMTDALVGLSGDQAAARFEARAVGAH